MPDAQQPQPPAVTPPPTPPSPPQPHSPAPSAAGAAASEASRPPAQAAPRNELPHTPVSRAKPPQVATDDRRDFFSDAMREALGPLAGILERKINPLLAALEAIPAEAERFANVTLPGVERGVRRVLDQPSGDHPLPQFQDNQAPVATRFLRPPGAMAPGEFETICSRCGKCVEACPARAIQLDDRGLLADGFPFIMPKDQPCVVCNDLACMPACPTGALKVVERLNIDMGTAKVDHHLCLRDHGEDCRLCVDVCPVTGEGAAPEGDAIIIHQASGRVRIRKNICIGCGLCESRCPTYPQAITVTPYSRPSDPIIA